jgi:hypothetical protein
MLVDRRRGVAGVLENSFQLRPDELWSVNWDR